MIELMLMVDVIIAVTLITIYSWIHIFVHEGFHFLACKLLKLRVLEVQLGYGDLIKRKWGKYKIKTGALPLAGYVKFLSKNDLHYAIVIMAGPIGTLLLALFAPTLLFKQVMYYALFCAFFTDGIALIKLFFKYILFAIVALILTIVPRKYLYQTTIKILDFLQ